MPTDIAEIPTDDMYVVEVSPDENYTPDSRYLRVQCGYYREGIGKGNMRTLLRFTGKWRDRIPEGAKIVSAKVWMHYFVWMGYDHNPRDIAIHRVLEDWKEEELTWNTQPSFEPEPTSIRRCVPAESWRGWDVMPDLDRILYDDWVSWCVKDHHEGEVPVPAASWQLVSFAKERDPEWLRKVPSLVLTYMFISNIQGSVIDKDTHGPIEGVEITIDGLVRDSDANGKFQLLEIEAKKYGITAQKVGYKTYQGEIDVSVPGDYELTIELEKGANIYGTVIDSTTNEPIRGAGITLDGLSRLSDSEGKFQFLDLDAKVYSIIVKRFGYKTYEDEIDASEGGDYTITIELEKIPEIPPEERPPSMLAAGVVLLGTAFMGTYLLKKE